MLIFTIFMFLISLSESQSEASDPVCREQTYNCGKLLNISYPFWGLNRSSSCGGGDPFHLKCNNTDLTTSIQIGSQNFTVKDINMKDQTMRVARTDLVYDVCSPQFEDTHLITSLFPDSSSVYYISIFYDYNCSSSIDTTFGVIICGDQTVIFREGTVEDHLLKLFPSLERCSRRHVQVPVDLVPYSGSGGRDFLDRALARGIPLDYTTLLKSNKWNKKTKLIIGVTGASIAGLLICIGIASLIYKSSTWQARFGLTAKSNKNIETFLKDHGALTLKRYKLSDVKKMTNSYKVKLGQGGFGVVYKGKLPNGAAVAVKILNASKKNGEEFMNEVASISRTSHLNVVTLLGFCLESQKKALIYEFMPNGSLDNLIYRREPETIAPWDVIYQIAKGIARGLEYLHIGCNTRILHFDIKPHNILLDETFCPKISDFGLAKLCPRNESIVSMSNARGTMGYVAPEMWSRHLGGVSHKSDVYSYGMMLLEMVGGRKNINAEAGHASEIYFPHWVYKKLELDNDLRPDQVMSTEGNEIAKRLAIVGLWCIQTFPNNRPTMSRVIEMLEGSMNSLKIPPKPLLSSPSSSPPESSIPRN